MNTKEIEILLDKYFEALTTVDEENILRSYFQREDIADHLKSVQSLFWLIERQKAEKTEIDHEERLMEKIFLKKEKGLHQKRLFYFASSIAAIVLLFLSIIYFNTNEKPVPPAKYSPEEIQLAMIQTTNALNYISLKLNKGTSQLYHLQKFEPALHTLAKNLSKLDREIEKVNNQHNP